MSHKDYKQILDQLIHNELYGTSFEEQKVEEVYSYLENADSFFLTLRDLIHLRTNDTLYAYEKYIKNFLLLAHEEIKLEILNNQTQYEDIIKEENTYLALWVSLTFEEKRKYLENKKKFTLFDSHFISDWLKNIKEKDLILSILLNEKIINKIIPYSVDFSNTTLSLTLDDFSSWIILTPYSFTQILLKQYQNFSSFLTFYNKNKGIGDMLIEDGLKFSQKENEAIYAFLLENPNFIGKFHPQYLKLFSIMEIKKISKIPSLERNSYSRIIEKLYQYNQEEVSIYFNEESLKKCAKHSLRCFPFLDLPLDIRNKILTTNTLLNRFQDTIIVDAISSFLEEEDIVSLLRKDSFIEEMSSSAIGLLLNKLSFKAAFNMLQRKNILCKIENLNNHVEKKDSIFFPGFLDSPSLVYKANHKMLYTMLHYLNQEDFKYYITLPYINSCLSTKKLMDLFIEKNCPLIFIFSNPTLAKLFNNLDYIYYIDETISNSFDFSIFLNKDFNKIVFALDENILDQIDFKEVNYLFETIRMKSLLSHQNNKISFATYKTVLLSYLTLGLDNTLSFISKGNSEISFTFIKNLQKKISLEKLMQFKEEKSYLFQDMPKRLVDTLNQIDTTISKEQFEKIVEKNKFLLQVIQEMSSYASYSSILEEFYRYVFYRQDNLLLATHELNAYLQLFIQNCINKQKKAIEEEFEKTFIKNVKPKEKVLYRKKQEIEKLFLDKTKLKLFIQILISTQEEKYKKYFSPSFPFLKIKEKYTHYLHSTIELEDIVNHILIPYSNERFNKENVLKHLGIYKPKEYDSYEKYLEDLQSITEINSVIASYKKKLKMEDILSLLNYICYGSTLLFKTKKKDFILFSDLRDKVLTLDGEVYIDKSTSKLLYNSLLDFDVKDTILEYKYYLDLIEDILKKTKRFLNRYMLSDVIKQNYEKEYRKAIHSFNYVFPLTEKYYDLKRRVFTFSDLEKIFNGYEINKMKKFDSSLKHFLLQEKNLVILAEGYYGENLIPFGLLLSNWEEIEKKAKDLKIKNLTIINAHSLFSLISTDKIYFSTLLDKDIISSLMKNGDYEEYNFNLCLKSLCTLYQNSIKRCSSSIPYFTYYNDKYMIKVLDSYDKDSYINFTDIFYKTGTLESDLFCYSLLNKNGCQIGIYDNSILIGKILGIRKGNILYLHTLEGHVPNMIVSLLKEFGQELLKYTMYDVEPLEIITIVNNKNYTDTLGLQIDISYFEAFSSNKSSEDEIEYSYLFQKNIMKIYKNEISTLIASSVPIDKNNFKFYDPQDRYKRKRNKVQIYSSWLNIEQRHKIDIIFYLLKKEGLLDYPKIDLFAISSLYLGDDYVLLITNTKEIIQFVLPYDNRSLKEIEKLIQKI